MEQKMINLTINEKPIHVPEGTTILEAAKQEGIYIPSLCYLDGIHQFGGCRMCMVQVMGAKTLMAACMVPAQEGMVVYTNSAKARKARKLICELILSDHPQDCLHCFRSGTCELQDAARQLGVTEHRFPGERSADLVEVTPSITRDMAKCVLCRRCVSMCNKIQGVGIMNAQNRGFKTVIGPAMNQALEEVDCTYCGQCINVCPVNALKETDGIAKVWEAISNDDIHTVVQIAPAVRVGIGEEFGIEGQAVTGKLASALKELLFNDVFDTNFGADLTIMEEGTEFLSRAKSALTGGDAVLPMITSCSPGWIKFCEHNFPQSLDNLSTCKSPHMMEGALIKSYYAEKLGKDPKDIFVVSVMPCTAKKFEAARPEMCNANGLPDVDAVLTTRELARMIREAGIDFVNMQESDFDAPMGLSSGAADIFGVTGGVMEAALRTVHELVTGKELPFDQLHVTPIVGFDQIKEADLKFEKVLPAYKFLEGVTVKVAVTSGLTGARKLMEQIEAGTSPYHFIEVMGCPGGCIAGGGQPRGSYNSPVKAVRSEAIYAEDEGKKLRKSHENPDIKKLYSEYLLEPLGHKSHALLHTHYTARKKYNTLDEESNE